MKITKDILNYLEVSSIYIIKPDDIHICIPVQIENDRWKISTDTSELKGNALIKLKFKNKLYYFKIHIDEICSSENFTFTYNVHLTSSTEINLFMLELSVIEKKLKNWEKRKEERYEIGFDEKKIEQLSLKGYEQKVIINKLTLPCVVNDISFSGMKLTTVDSNFSRDKKIVVYLSFINPIEQILLGAYIRNINLKEMQGQVAATLSLQFEEPTISYKQRIADFITKQQKLAQDCAN